MSARRIAVITGTRADYGLLYWLIHDLHHAPEFDLQLVVTGMHLSARFGHTVEAIERDGFPIAARIPLDLSSDEPERIGQAMGYAVADYSRSFAELQPDIVVILGDRFEMLAAATAAYVQRFPIAHIHGGEVTEGALDEGFRHAITKLSHLHFTAAEPYRQRVIRMGEQPERVFNVGAPGLEHLTRTPFLSRSELEESLDFRLGEANFLVTFHPATLDPGDLAGQCRELLAALEAFPEAHVIFTQSNADPGGQAIIDLVEDHVRRHPERCRLYASLGQLRYLSLLGEVQAVIGNSSSGIIEAPGRHAPTVNIGDRQSGRMHATSVVDCPPERQAIEQAIRRVLSDEFLAQPGLYDNPYGSGDSARQMLEVLATVDPSQLSRKSFYDPPTEPPADR